MKGELSKDDAYNLAVAAAMKQMGEQEKLYAVLDKLQADGYFENQSAVKGGADVVYKDGRIVGIVDNSTDGRQRSSYTFENNDLNLMNGYRLENYNELGLKTDERIMKGDWDIQLTYDGVGRDVADYTFSRWNGNSYGEVNMDELFAQEMNNKVGAKYYSGGGQMPSINGMSNVDANGNWLGYDCVGGVVDSIRDVLGFNLNQFNDFNVSKLKQQDWLTQIATPSTGNLIFQDSSHVMTYNQWTNSDNRTYDLITTLGGRGLPVGDMRFGSGNGGQRQTNILKINGRGMLLRDRVIATTRSTGGNSIADMETGEKWEPIRRTLYIRNTGRSCCVFL